MNLYFSENLQHLMTTFHEPKQERDLQIIYKTSDMHIQYRYNLSIFNGLCFRINGKEIAVGLRVKKHDSK